MSNTLQQVVETQLKITDQATGPMEKAAKSAEHLGGAFESIESTVGHLLPSLGAFGIALSLHGALDTTEKYLKNIKEVHELTGATASETDFLFSSARKAGVEYDAMKDTMFQLSRRGAMLEQSMALSNGKTVPSLAKKFERLGVDVTKGPVDSLVQMSDAVKTGKIGVGELMTQFRVPKGQVNDFKQFLENLDKTKLKAAKHGGPGLVNDKDLEEFMSMEQAQHRIHDAWNRIQVMLGKTLMPILAHLTDRFADKMEKVVPIAEKFGRILVDHMGEVFFVTKAIVAALTAKKVLGVLENLTSPKGIIGKLAGGGLSALGGGGGVGALFSQIGGIVNTFGAAAPYLVIIAAAVWAAVKGWEAVRANVDGVRDRILFVWEKIQARVEDIGDAAERLVEPLMQLFGQDGTFGQMVAKFASLGFEFLVEQLDNMVHVVQTFIHVLGDLVPMFQQFWQDVLAKPFKDYVVDPLMWSMRQLGKFVDDVTAKFNFLAARFGGTSAPAPQKDLSTAGLKDFFNPTAIADIWKKNWEKTEQNAFLDAKMRTFDNRRADEATRRSAGETKPPAPNYDFRGSKFDVTQKFSEGFDPDRIAVAFANDLSALGEMRAQSNFLPITSAAR